MDAFSDIGNIWSVLLTSALLFIFLKSSRLRKKNGSAPYERASALALWRNRHRYLDWITQLHSSAKSNTILIGPVPGGLRAFLTIDPSNVEHILKENLENYPKGQRLKLFFHEFLGDGIFNVDGEQWRMQRTPASLEFSAKSFKKFVVETVQWEITNRLMIVLSQACDSQILLDVHDIMKRFAFDSICKMAFGMDPSCLHPSLPFSRFQQAFDDATDVCAERFFYFMPDFSIRIKRLLNIGSERKLREAMMVVDEFVMDIIRSRRTENFCGREDLLARFIKSCKNEMESELLVLFLKDIVVNIMMAGRDTTSSALTWLFWLISCHPKVEEGILREIQQVLEKREGAEIFDNNNEKKTSVVYSSEELKSMKYLHAAVSESLRLYPSVPVMCRFASKDDVLPDGTVVPKGALVGFSIYSMARMERIWGRDCREFKPERWLKEGCYQAESSFKFATFGGGSRICLGKEAAFVQMKSVVASVVHSFSLKVEEGYTPQYSPCVALSMKGGLPVHVRRR